MNITHFSGSKNNYKHKIRQNNTTSNTKLNQHPNKIRKLNRTPINPLNKSQNIIITKNVFKTNINHLTNNNSIFINAKKKYPIQNMKNLNFVGKNLNMKLSSFLNNNKDRNRSISKNKSLSNYFTKTCNKIKHGLKRNYTNKILLKINNDNISNYNQYIKNNICYQKTNVNNLNNNNKEKSPIIKIKDFLDNENILAKNIGNTNESSYPLVITEESKKLLNENRHKSKIKKPESLCSTYIKINYPSIKKIKASSTTMIAKPNYILNNNQNKSNINSIISDNQISSSEGLLENLSTKKNNDHHAQLESFEKKIINELKELKNCKKNDLIERIKIIINEAIESLVPKESQNIFLLLIKQIFLINKEYSEIIINLKKVIENMKNKIINYQNKFKELMSKMKNKEKEIDMMKKEIEKYYQKKTDKNMEIKNIIKDNNNTIKKKLKKNISSLDLKIKRDYNVFIKNLNTKNIDDLDALYFYDKINYNQNEEDKDIPKLNLEKNHIENCIQKEIIRRNEINLTPFQKVALQFEFLGN